jgi:hypothetical protein
VLEGEAGADNSTSMKLYAGADDTRTIVSYPANNNVAIDQTGTHSHVDEFARMPGGGEALWQSVETTVAPEGSLHIVTRGAGPNYAARLWRQALIGKSRLHPFFARYDARPGRDDAWLAKEAESLTEWGLYQFAPRTWQEAIQGDASYVYPMFDSPPGRHIVPAHPCELALCRRVVIGIDPGGTDPTALVLFGERTSGRIHQYAEAYGQHMTLDAIEAKIQDWWTWNGKRPLTVVVPADEATVCNTLREHLRKLGIVVLFAENDRDAGIGLVTQRLNTDGLTVYSGCEETILEYQDYRIVSVTDATTKVVYAGDRPVKHHADCMDASRYAVMEFAQGREVGSVKMAGGYTIRGRR